MQFKSKISIHTILILFLALLSPIYFSIIGMKEGFLNKRDMLMPGDYPISDTQPILVGYYPVKKNPEVTKNNAAQNWVNYPVYPSSFKQITNNVRYWMTPDNGKCSPPEFCGTPYNAKPCPNFDLPKPLPFDSNQVRVNYFEANNQECLTQDYGIIEDNLEIPMNLKDSGVNFLH